VPKRSKTLAFDPKQHYENSSLRENIVEHLFIGLALGKLWNAGITNAEILRSEFDAYGYDLVISYGDIVRHVQMKTSTSLTKVSVSKLLAQKSSGCVLFIKLDNCLNLGPFYFFGATAGQQLPDLGEFKSTRRTAPKSDGKKHERKMHHDIPLSKFQRFETIEKLMANMLGTTDIG
jgi:hypothetical protein